MYFRFDPEDFISVTPRTRDDLREEIARICNEKFEKWLDTQENMKKALSIALQELHGYLETPYRLRAQISLEKIKKALGDKI